MISFCIYSMILFACLPTDLTEFKPFVFLTQTSVPSSYEDLHYTESEAGEIRYIITTVAQNEWYYLLWIQNELFARGEKIEHLHPFKFLEAIFTNLELKECMRQIRSSLVKWYPFHKDLKKSFLKRLSKNDLLQYIPEFSESLNIDPSKVRACIEKKDWDRLVDYLLR